MSTPPPLLSEILGAKRGEEERRVSLSVVRSFVPPFSLLSWLLEMRDRERYALILETIWYKRSQLVANQGNQTRILINLSWVKLCLATYNGINMKAIPMHFLWIPTVRLLNTSFKLEHRAFLFTGDSGELKMPAKSDLTPSVGRTFRRRKVIFLLEEVPWTPS